MWLNSLPLPKMHIVYAKCQSVHGVFMWMEHPMLEDLEYCYSYHKG